jgi:hypothetical protein
MPDPAAPFMQNLAPNLLASQNLQPTQQSGQTAAQGFTNAAQNFLNPYQALLQRYGIRPGVQQAGTGNPNASQLPSAVPQPVGGGMAQPPAPAPQAMPGTSPAPGMMPQAPGMPMNLLPQGMGY